MKKLLFVLFILLILGGMIFFFGWTQFRLDRDSYGVVYTRTHGYAREPIVSGEFSWSPWALIPSNMEIVQIPSNQRSVHITARRELPQAELFARVLSGEPDFSFTLSAEVTYAPTPAFALEAVEEQGVTPQKVSTWLIGLDNSLQQTAKAFLDEYTSSELTEQTAASEIPQLASAYLERQLSSYFPELVITDVRALFTSIPDLSLYAEARSQYEELIERKQQALFQAIDRDPDSMAEHMIYIDQLESYGKLITRYPLLLDYLEIEGRYGAQSDQ